MTVRTMALLWALAGLAVAVTLIAAAGRLGRTRAAAWLVVLGLVMLAVEEPVLTLYWAVTDPSMDRDGMATRITAPASAHVLDSAVLAAALMVLFGWIALSGLRHEQRWAIRVLTAGWLLIAATIAVTALTVYARGLPLPTTGGRAEGAGYGWEQLAVGLFAWACGLWLARVPRKAPVELGSAG